MGLPFPGAIPFGPQKKGKLQKGGATAKGAAAKPVQGSKTPVQKMSKAGSVKGATRGTHSVIGSHHVGGKRKG